MMAESSAEVKRLNDYIDKQDRDIATLRDALRRKNAAMEAQDKIIFDTMTQRAEPNARIEQELSALGVLLGKQNDAIVALRAELAAVTAERDAAVAKMETVAEALAQRVALADGAVLAARVELDALRAKVDAVPSADAVDAYLRELAANSDDGVQITHIPADGMYSPYFSVKLFSSDTAREGQGITLAIATKAVLPAD